MRKSLVVLVALLALAPACAKKKYGSPASGGGTPVSLPGTTNNHGTKDLGTATDVEVEQDNFYFNPTFIKAAPGSTVKVDLKNEGNTAHTFTIDAVHVDKQVEPGKTATVNVAVPQSGALLFYCRFHQSSGMQGAIYSTAGASVGSPAATSSSSGGGGGYGQ